MGNSLEITFDKIGKTMYLEYDYSTDLRLEIMGHYFTDIISEETFNFFYKNFKSKFDIKHIDYENSICQVYAVPTCDISYPNKIKLRITVKFEPMTAQDIEADRIETMIKNLS